MRDNYKSTLIKWTLRKLGRSIIPPAGVYRGFSRVVWSERNVFKPSSAARSIRDAQNFLRSHGTESRKYALLLDVKLHEKGRGYCT